MTLIANLKNMVQPLAAFQHAQSFASYQGASSLQSNNDVECCRRRRRVNINIFVGGGNSCVGCGGFDGFDGFD
ncbi:hypothetical protein SAMD00019534_037150 [Acytostelium subglobosum LB1]|uniref:hypothetical protein n=1 Tax=Acytostelium subglobosum LB1 TaxID=1410327 RepID=UPI000644CFAE|nr:hypothetical protein SAMD00019534_037150 [Acytostelium subglobosum LB1]GAM20540.1 hypothetical protein SAMD00019534_037150 [Acytostelium subglobosum LB1]|eukprot:XP_012760061.1 hypothetical protein SAMD00019534_037150 [Acytostelium subglobosum LB1]